MYFPSFRPDQHPLGGRRTRWAERWADGGIVLPRKDYQGELDVMTAQEVSLSTLIINLTLYQIISFIYTKFVI